MCHLDMESMPGKIYSWDITSSAYPEYLCQTFSPGRFFAANEIKVMMEHIILNYDIKFENEGVRPANKWFGLSLAPDPTVKVFFRKRRGQL